MSLPDISSIARSEQAFGESFLRVGYILSQYLKQIELAVAAREDFTDDPFNLVVLGLFSKLRCHYYSSVLLEVHNDQIGSQFLIEQLCETAVTLTYLLEEADESIFSEYISASVRQGHHLLADVEDKLQTLPKHPGLLVLRDKLKLFIAQQQKHPATPPTTACSDVYPWGLSEADTTAKRGTMTGLGFMTNPARSINLSIVPASWLDLQVNYSRFTAGSSYVTESSSNFMYLRDTAHLCLHATRAFLEEVANTCQNTDILDIESLFKGLDIFFQWFYNAHEAYKMQVAAGAAELNSSF